MSSHEGVPIKLVLFREWAAVGVVGWSTLCALVPDPRREETPGALRYDRRLREHAELRGDVQRLLKGTKKGTNVGSYAAYIAAGIRGDLGRGWSTPPLCLWSSRELHVHEDGSAILPLSTPIVAVDAETQVAAMHHIMNKPDEFELDAEAIESLRVPFEIYWGLTTADAKQIFHDRNLFGVPVAKTLALSMDQRDFGTILAQRAVAVTEISIDGQSRSLSKFVNTRKRQLGKNDPEWITLSSLRSLAVTMLLGKPGIERTSGTIEARDVPADVGETQAQNEVTAIIGSIMKRFTDEFARRSSITAPAVLAGIGAAANHVTSWCKDQQRLTREQLVDLLAEVKWEREAKYWEGVAAKRTASGGLSFAGGAKDSGHRVCDAILQPESALGMRIRGR